MPTALVESLFWWEHDVMVLAHGGTMGAIAEFVILFVPLIVVFYLARKKSRDDAADEAGEGKPRDRNQ